MNERILELLPALVMSVGGNVVALIVATLLHEFGHAAAGYVAGLRVARVQLGPLEIRDYGRPHVRLVPSLQAGVVLVPFDRTAALEPLRWGLIVSTAAGPLIGLVSGAVILALDGGPRFDVSFSLAQAVGHVSVILGLLNLLPLRSGEQLADGRRIFSLLLRNRESGHILVATLMVAEALSGRRPREWDPGLLALMERSPDEVFARLCLYEAAIDRGEIEAAGRHLDAAVVLRSVKWTAADILFTEAAYYAARHRSDARAARALLGLADGGDVADYMRARAEAAVLCAEGRGLEGRQRAVVGLAALKRAERRDEGPCREQLEELARGAGALVRPLLTRAR